MNKQRIVSLLIALNLFLTSCSREVSNNTNNKNINEVKKVLEKWLNMYSEKYKKSNRVATLNNFKKALFTFFIFTIQASINVN